MLLSLYETKIHMLENPKKKSKMWTAIAEELKSLNVEVSKLNWHQINTIERQIHNSIFIITINLTGNIRSSKMENKCTDKKIQRLC